METQRKKTDKLLKKLAYDIATNEPYDAFDWIYGELLNIKQALLKGRFYIGVISVSNSGMSRRVKLAYIKNNTLYAIRHPKILKLAGCNEDGRISGCGMDMLFAAQYNLFHSLHKNYKQAHYQRRMKRYNEL